MPKKRLSIDADVVEAAKAAATELGTTISAFVEQVILDRLDAMKRSSAAERGIEPPEIRDAVPFTPEKLAAMAAGLPPEEKAEIEAAFMRIDATIDRRAGR